MCPLYKQSHAQHFTNDQSLANPHVLFEDVSSGLHFNHTVDDQFTVRSQ